MEEIFASEGEEQMNILLHIVMFAISVSVFISLIWGIKAIYTFFRYRKDERMKMIVVKSMSQSFVVLLSIQVIHFLLRMHIRDSSHALWRYNYFAPRIEVEPFALYLVILGVSMFINKRRFSVKKK